MVHSTVCRPVHINNITTIFEDHFWRHKIQTSGHHYLGLYRVQLLLYCIIPHAHSWMVSLDHEMDEHRLVAVPTPCDTSFPLLSPLIY